MSAPAPVVVVSGGSPAGVDLAAGLQARGTPVAVLNGGDPPSSEESDASRVAAPSLDGPHQVACDFSSSSSLGEALDHAAGALGSPPRAAVWCRVPPGCARSQPVAELDETRWAQLAEVPLTELFHFLQALHPRLRGGGRVIVVVASLVMNGAAGVVGWTTALEGQRSLARVTARQWGRDGITVNCVAVPGDLLSGSEQAMERPGTAPSALGKAPSIEHDVARVVGTLLRHEWSTVTGATVAVDGGVWMTP